MAKIISFSVDLSKIDKTKIKQINKKDGTLAPASSNSSDDLPF